MKNFLTLIQLTALSVLLLSGCATTDEEYHDDQEYSDMPWNTPQQWEGSQSIPGMSPGQ